MAGQGKGGEPTG